MRQLAFDRIRMPFARFIEGRADCRSKTMRSHLLGGEARILADVGDQASVIYASFLRFLQPLADGSG